MFGDRDTLLQRYNMDSAPVRDEYEAIMGCSPTLAVMNSTFGRGTAEVIIAAKLSRLNQYTNVKMKITPEQAYEMAVSIAADTDLKGIKGDVLALFFERLKTGAFGELYNIIDAVSLSSKLRKFFRECEAKRIAWIDSAEREQFYKEMDEHRKNAITLEQFKQTDAYKRLKAEEQSPPA